MADKFHSDMQEVIETINYSPGVQDTGDLETGTNTITATSEASGIGNADYNKALTLLKPSDARLEIKKVAARLAATIDSFGGSPAATHLYCRVYVDALDADHRLFDEDWDSTGAKLDSSLIASGTLYDLLRDGASHTFYFFFWVDQGMAVISVVELWEGVGATAGESYHTALLTHTGFASLYCDVKSVGTGSSTAEVYTPGGTIVSKTGSPPRKMYVNCVLTKAPVEFTIVGLSVATDIHYWNIIAVTLRSIQ